MKPLLAYSLRNRWFVLSLHIGMWALLYLAAMGLRGTSPPYREDLTLPAAQAAPTPITRLNRLFSAGIWPKLSPGTNQINPFFTRHFIPPPTPPAPAPTTRRIELTYQGFYQTEGSPKHVIVKLADTFLDVPLGANLAANLFAAEASMQSLTLTNSTAQTNLLRLNTKQELEVPIR